MGTWSNWDDLGGAVISAPSVASRVGSKMTVVARGSQNQIVQRYWNDGAGWGDWQDLGGRSTYDPAIIAYRPDRYTVYVVGGKQVVFRKTWIEGSDWNNWSQTNETTTVWGGLAAASSLEGRIDLFGLDPTNSVLHATAPPDAGWGPFSSIGGTIQGRMAAASWSSGRIDLVARGASSNKLWHRVLTGSAWGNWREIGSRFISGPEVSTWGPDRLDVFAKGHEHQLLHRFWNGQSWSDWLDLGTVGTDDAPAAVSREKGNIELFIRGRDNHLYHRTYTADADELNDQGGVPNAS